MSKKCKHKDDTRGKCKAWAMLNSDFCFFHNPETKDYLTQSTMRGGLNRQILTRASLPPLDIKSREDVIGLLCDTINLVRCNVMPPQIANSVGYLSSHLLKAFEKSEDEAILEKLTSLEKLITEPEKDKE